MIKINLCPVDELENPYWYAPDLASILIVAIAAYLGVQYYFGTIEDQIAAVQSETIDKRQAEQRLKPALERFKNLKSNIADLNGRIQALQSITVSKVSRYKPVIVAEHLQNLKPEGVWYQSLKIGTKADATLFELEGQAFDNILVAELMTSMRSTANQELDEADLRTQIYFGDLTLTETGLKSGSGGAFPELSGYPTFFVKGKFKERSVPVVPAAGSEEKNPADAKAMRPVSQKNDSTPESRM